MEFPLIPLFYLGDCDPFGLDILLNYTFSNEYQTFELNSLPHIHYLGVTIDEVVQLKVSKEDSLLNLNEQDLEKLKELRTKPFFLEILKEENEETINDLQLYLKTRWRKWYENILDFEKFGKKLELDSFEELTQINLIKFIKYKILSSI